MSGGGRERRRVKIRTLGVDGGKRGNGGGWDRRVEVGESGETHRREGDTRSWRSSSYERRGATARGRGGGRGSAIAALVSAEDGLPHASAKFRRVPFAGERVAADERENK